MSAMNVNSHKDDRSVIYVIEIKKLRRKVPVKNSLYDKERTLHIFVLTIYKRLLQLNKFICKTTKKLLHHAGFVTFLSNMIVRTK